MMQKLKTFMNIIRFYKAIGEVIMNPTIGAIFLVKHPNKELFRAVLFRRHVCAKYDMYGKTNSIDRMGPPDYKLIFDRVEWPFPNSAFPNGICPTCYRALDENSKKSIHDEKD